MKKITAILLTLILALSLVACGGSGDNTDNNEGGEEKKEKTFDAAYTTEFNGYEILAADITTFWRVGEDVTYSENVDGSRLDFSCTTNGEEDTIGVHLYIYTGETLDEWAQRWNASHPDELCTSTEFLGEKAYTQPSTDPKYTNYYISYEGLDGYISVSLFNNNNSDESELTELAQAVFDNIIIRPKADA